MLFIGYWAWGPVVVAVEVTASVRVAVVIFVGVL